MTDGGKKWTKERCAEMLRLAAVDGVVKYGDAYALASSLPAMAARHWGSFTLACEAIGLVAETAARERYSVCMVDGCEKPSRSSVCPVCDMHYCRQRRRQRGVMPVQAQPVLKSSRGYLIDHAPGHRLNTRGLKRHVFQHRRVFYDAMGEGPFVCHVCGAAVRWDNMHVDHIDENKQNNSITNLAPACPGCNIGRSQHKSIAAAKARGVQLTAFGGTQCLSDWAREVGITHFALSSRLASGWQLERALSEPRGKHGPAKQRKDQRPSPSA